LSAADAKAVKDTWDLLYREQIAVPASVSDPDRLSVLTGTNRAAFLSGIHIVLEYGRREDLIGPSMDSFILGLPEYPRPSNGPRPRPLSFGDFQRLVSDEALTALDAADKSDIGFADIWLTHAFQGGRIGETLRLRLGCVGLIGAAQPYIWRDISKANVIDYGMPCHLPVYRRLLRRQSLTRAKLRARYADQFEALDEEGRAQQEAEWDREMPLLPRVVQNPDLVIPLSQSGFRLVFLEWLKGLGLSGITTHQTRATLATSLLNNGAPAALVRQLLGHFSEESLTHYARYSDDNIKRHLQQVWAAGPGMDKPGAILLRPADLHTSDGADSAARIDLTVIPVEHGLCRYGPVVGGSSCPFKKNCTNGPNGPCEHFVLTGADLAYWERKREPRFTSQKVPPPMRPATTSSASGTGGSQSLTVSAKPSTNWGCWRTPRNSICEARCKTTSTRCSRRDGL
jgi:integrase